LLLGGSSICFITSAEDSHAIHKNSSAFNHDKFLQLTARQFGVSKQGVKKLWSKIDPSSLNSRPIAKIMVIVRRELCALRRPDGLPNAVLQRIQHLSAWENWSPRSIEKTEENVRIISLSNWVRDIFMHGMTQVLFGDAMMQINPDLVDDFYTFDDRSWMVLFGIPLPWSMKMRRALNRTQHAIKTYLDLPTERRADASLVMKHLEVAMSGRGYLRGDVPAVLSLIFWG
jgi:hypothetical protein